MAPAFDATSYIYQGVWIDWTRGRIQGTTLTLSPTNAAILSPALAILISVAGAQLWRLFQFSLHQARATTTERNFVYHQSQSILRNTATDLNALWRLLRIAFAWRHHQDAHLFKTILPLVLWTALHLGVVVIAGVLSSWLLDDGNRVLSISPWCGSFDQAYLNAVFATSLDSDLVALTRSTEYSRYTNSRFVLAQQTLDVNTAAGASLDAKSRASPLPFSSTFVPNMYPLDASMCHPSAGGSMIFDTGLLSSHTHLGYNSRASDRISVRMLTQCVPLQPEGYSTPWQTVWNSDLQASQQIADAHYGLGPTNRNNRNATVTMSRQIPTCDEKFTQPAFKIIPFNAFPDGNGSYKGNMKPIKSLRPSDSDLNLVFSSYANLYTHPVLDPWFSADQPINSSSSSSPCAIRNFTMYERKYPLSTMACTQQFQVCNTDSVMAINSHQCTKLGGRYQLKASLYSDKPEINLTPRQMAIIDRVVRINPLTSTYYMIMALVQSNISPLQLRYDDYSTLPLPAISPTQWRNETDHWQRLMLGYYQQAHLDYSTGQFAASTDYINISKPSSKYPHVNANVSAAQDAAHWLCQTQVIQSKVYRNFNFFWLLFTVSCCTVVIILGISIEDIMGAIRARNSRHPGRHPKQSMWNANSDLDMLRCIDELKHGTRWSLSGNGIPVTHTGHKISGGDLTVNGHDTDHGDIVLTDLRSIKNSPYGHGKSRKCATCSQFDLSVGSHSRSTSQSQLGTREGQERLTFENRIPNGGMQFPRAEPGVLVQ